MVRIYFFLAAISISLGMEAQSSDGDFGLKTKNASLSVSRAGGRILSLKYGNTELITLQSEHENFGSTLWTGPQSNWGWPPFKVLDKQDYSALYNTDSLYLCSQEDSLSGFQVSKTIKADKNRDCLIITYCVKNISKENKKVDAWEVTRVPVGGLAFFPEGETAPVPASNLDGVTRMNNFVWFECDMKPMQAGQKLFASAKEGWLAYLYRDVLFIKQFPDITPAEYSPQQGEVEVYANEDRKYFELENHGPYTLLTPGQSLQYRVRWYVVQQPSSNRDQLIARVKSIIKLR